MKIVSWNVNGIRSIERKGLLPALWSFDADIVCIQEAKAERDQLSKDILEPQLYTTFLYSSNVRKGHSGVMSFTKQCPLDVVYGGIMSDRIFDDEGRIMTLMFTDVAGIGNIAVVNCYFPNGADRSHHESGGGLEYKLEFYKNVSREIERLRKQTPYIVVCGDFNVAHQEIDIARPRENTNHVGFLPIEREWFTSLMDMGWVDAYRLLHPDTVSYTWWDVITRARERNVGWRIDYHVVSPALVPHIVSCENIVDFMGSDHCPVILELQ